MEIENEHANNLRVLMGTTIETASKILDESAAASARLLVQDTQMRAVTRTLAKVVKENRELREALQEILRLEKASPNVGVKLIAELALRGDAISASQDVDT